MNLELVSPAFVPILIATFLVFEMTGALLTWMIWRASAAAMRGVLVGVWLIGAAVIAAYGYGQYGLSVVPVAAIAVALSLAVVYLLARHGARRKSWPAAVVMVSVAAVCATLALAVSLLYLLQTFGIDSL